MKKNKKEENGTLQEVLYLVIGVLFIVRMFFEDFSLWSVIDYLKLAFGLFLIGFGVYKLRASRSKSS